MKKLLATLLTASLLATCLVGCGDKTEEKKSDTSNDTSVVTSVDDNGSDEGATLSLAEQAIADRKAKAAETGEYQKVVVSFFDWTGAPAGIERVNSKLSEYTEETLGLDVELLIIDSAAYTQDIQLMLAATDGEQIDLFSTCGPGYMTIVNNEFAHDLEEDGLLDNYGAKLKDIVRADYFDACRVGGTLYGVPPIKDYAIQTAAICIGTEYLEGANVDLSKYGKDDLGYVKATWDDIDEIFAAIHAAFPEKTVYSTQDNMITQGSAVDMLAGDWYGVLLDPANSLEVSNLFESDMYKEWCDRFYRWNQAGYIAKDALTDENGASARIKSGSYMAMMACGKPAYENQISNECARPMTVFDVGEPFMSSSAVSSFPWCINENSEDYVAAMQVLEALYTDPVVANFACWGEEGVEYVVNADTTINWGPGVDANTSEYFPNVLWLMPNQYAAHVWEGDPVDVGEQTAAFNDNCPVKSKALGFTWDNSEYAAEFTALQNAYKQFAGQLIYGFVEPEEGIKALNDALKSAGLDTYIAAKQAAVDAWANK